MNKKIDEIIQELIALDPSFAAHESQMRTLIAELLLKKPDTRLDEQFVARLRAQLQGVPTPSPLKWTAYMPYTVFAVLAVLIVAPLGYYAATRANDPVSGSAVFAMNQEIEQLPGGAYGALQAQAGGRGGSGAEMTPMAASMDVANPVPGYERTAATYAASDAKMIAPAGPITTYSYVYKGDPLDLTETDGQVYRRVPGQNSSGQIASQLRKFNFGLINLGAYTDARVRSFELVEDKSLGYSINVNFDEGMISINPNYTQWPSMSGKETSVQPLPMTAMPSDEESISIANTFLKDHGVSTANYGEPMVQGYAEMGIADTGMQYAPEQVTVTYPLKIKGTQVSEEGAYPYGIQVGVGVRDKRVMSVYGLSSQTYSSSDYKLETDSNKILSILGRGGVNAWVPEETAGVTIKKVEVEVGTPTKVLMHTYNYTDGQGQELFVPALSFPVTKTPAGEQYYPKTIVIPLVPELLNREGQGPVMYDMLR